MQTTDLSPSWTVLVMAAARHDYDWLVIGSCFGGSTSGEGLPGGDESGARLGGGSVLGFDVPA